MDAAKVKKKINGAVLKGKKIKVEEARPKKRRHAEVEIESSAPESNLPSSKNSSINSERKSKVITGHELERGRKVKRGWTEQKDSKSAKKKDKAKQASSKFTDGPELLFRAKMPPNKQGVADDATRKSKKKKGDATLVHEFTKTTIEPSFLRNTVITSNKSNLGYVDGQGWVDENGNTVEAEPGAVSKRRKTAVEGGDEEVLKLQKSQASRLSKSNLQQSQSSSSGSTSSKEDTSESDQRSTDLEDSDETSSSGSSSVSGAESINEGSTNSELDQTEPQATVTEAQSNTSLSQPAVHPLEALFKKPNKPASQDIAKPSLEVSTSFSFFDYAADETGEDESNMPGTPYSSQDQRARGLRSAAPTPDTAHPSRFNSNEILSEEDDENSGDDNGSLQEASTSKIAERHDLRTTPSQQSKADNREQSEFEKAFWEKRGDNNRAWKARRRAVLKEHRQRENRAKRPRNW